MAGRPNNDDDDDTMRDETEQVTTKGREGEQEVVVRGRINTAPQLFRLGDNLPVYSCREQQFGHPGGTRKWEW